MVEVLSPPPEAKSSAQSLLVERQQVRYRFEDLFCNILKKGLDEDSEESLRKLVCVSLELGIAEEAIKVINSLDPTRLRGVNGQAGTIAYQHPDVNRNAIESFRSLRFKVLEMIADCPTLPPCAVA